MAAIKLQFVAGKGISSWFIEHFGGIDEFSHVDSVFSDGLFGARNDVIEGIPAGVQLRPTSYLDGKVTRKVRFSLKVPTKIADKWETRLRSYAGAKYDQLDILGYALGDPRLDTPGEFICSGVATNPLRFTKILPKQLLVPDHQISPNSLALILSAVSYEGNYFTREDISL